MAVAACLDWLEVEIDELKQRLAREGAEGFASYVADASGMSVGAVQKALSYRLRADGERKLLMPFSIPSRAQCANSRTDMRVDFQIVALAGDLVFVTHRERLEDAPAAYKKFRDKKDGCIKVVLRP